MRRDSDEHELGDEQDMQSEADEHMPGVEGISAREEYDDVEATSLHTWAEAWAIDATVNVSMLHDAFEEALA